MNPYLEHLELYPFQRLAALKAGISGNPDLNHVALSIGEPKHAAPDFVVQALQSEDLIRQSLGAYPATRGSIGLRESCATWLAHRFGAKVNPESQVLPVAGTREALFSFAQAVLSGKPNAQVMLPNPFYQIYEGAALLRGAQLNFRNCEPSNDYLPSFDDVDAAQWQATELVFLCSPGNPTGRTLSMSQLQTLIEAAQKWNFVIAADECYSEIYPDEAKPPSGLLEACAQMGNDSFRNCVVFHSLSKRSNLPGLRSGFVAGDATILEAYFNYRTYEGCALPELTAQVSAQAWADETHVVANRELYRQKFQAVVPILEEFFQVPPVDGGFYCWLPTPGDDQAFARALFEQANITVLPGSFLGRAPTINSANPGAGHIRVAWVAPLDDCIAAARRLVTTAQEL